MSRLDPDAVRALSAPAGDPSYWTAVDTATNSARTAELLEHVVTQLDGTERRERWLLWLTIALLILTAMVVVVASVTLYVMWSGA